ncbi:unnamed protein product [Brachionus calyciflorus]|uniref:Guanylate cyclase soluble subunit beta-1 n=1 Tax=Brachionus calyciflorus TaxID=104777 RepID=A0A813M2I4_9BILA|nr:unnamed protein product [Brachionus calyciflorus]
MYGFVNFALEELVLRNFGEEIWTQIKKEAGVDIEGHFMIRVLYEDDATYSLVAAASKVLNLPANSILELFGQFFFEFCVESGYDKILSVLGSTTKVFLENLDALHDHLSTIYPGMNAPSFRCTEKSNGRFILHYYSDRPGLEFIVIGLVKTVALKLHKTEVECRVIKSKGEEDSDHVQFEIIEKRNESQDGKEQMIEKIPPILKSLNSKKLISPKSFCKAFPFHVIFDKNMYIKQCGTSIARLIPEIKNKNCKLTDIFSIIRPHINLEFQQIYSQIMSVFVLCKKNDNSDNSNLKPNNEDTNARFKGQMVYLPEKQYILFQCSLSIMSLEDLLNQGMKISDIPIHDANRDLILLNENWEEQWKCTQKLEILTDELKKTLNELELEKKKTENLLYSVLPPSIAHQLKQNKPVLPARYEQVTLMFCGIKDFGDICAKYSNNSQQIVNLLNAVFTKFDEKITKYPEIYKVETVGDKYMAVCGLPEKVDFHTKYLCLAALDIMDSVDKIPYKNEKIVITIGINCGEIVTGVIGKRMPRYCLFGDTVNLTSRCETTGIKGKINVSEFAYENLIKPEYSDPNFELEYRGEVTMKGKPRPIKMWLLSRKKSEFKYDPSLMKCPFSTKSFNRNL